MLAGQPGRLYGGDAPAACQQPVCEAFIMTGQSMLKLSSCVTGCALSHTNSNTLSHYHAAGKNHSNTSTITNNNNNTNNTNNNSSNNNNNNNNNTCEHIYHNIGAQQHQRLSASLNGLDGPQGRCQQQEPSSPPSSPGHDVTPRESRLGQPETEVDPEAATAGPAKPMAASSSDSDFGAQQRRNSTLGRPLAARHASLAAQELPSPRPRMSVHKGAPAAAAAAACSSPHSGLSAGPSRASVKLVPGPGLDRSATRQLLVEELERINSKRDLLEALPIEFRRAHLLARKHILEARAKPTPKGRRSWRKCDAAIEDLKLFFLPAGSLPTPGPAGPPGSPQAQPQLQLPSNHRDLLRIHHAFAKPAAGYKKRAHVFQLRLSDQSEYLVQTGDEAQLAGWVEAVNLAAACLSAQSPGGPAEPPSKRPPSIRRHPKWPAHVTRLFYWDQLLDHEQRLERLKAGLDEHLAQAELARTADKRAQSAFIDRIAFLRREIERYSVYVAVMRKNSNSPVALALSKWAQPANGSSRPQEHQANSCPTASQQQSQSQ